MASTSSTILNKISQLWPILDVKDKTFGFYLLDIMFAMACGK